MIYFEKKNKASNSIIKFETEDEEDESFPFKIKHFIKNNKDEIKHFINELINIIGVTLVAIYYMMYIKNFA